MMLSVPYIMVNSNSNKATPDGVKVKVLDFEDVEEFEFYACDG